MSIYISTELDPRWALAVLIAFSLASGLAALIDWAWRKWDDYKYRKYIEEKRKWRNGGSTS